MDETVKTTEPDNTAVRTALWRALHLQVDAKPYVIEDEVGLKLVAPEEGWQQRRDMDADFTKRLRASILARARFIEDLIIEQTNAGIGQCVMLGAGLDTFAQRHPQIAGNLELYEIDQAGTQIWKQQRLIELGYDIPGWLHFVPVNFETDLWWHKLLQAGFNVHNPAVLACTGVTLYLSKSAIVATLKQLTALAPGSTIAITFYLPIDMLDEEDRFLQQIAEKGAREAGTPFISFFAPDEILTLAHEVGFKQAKTISTKDMRQKYFANRTDNLLPASGEVFLLATT